MKTMIKFVPLVFPFLIIILHSCKKEELATLSTSTITYVTATSASGGGNITSDGNADVTARGVCWSLNINPTTLNSKTSDGVGVGQFISDITGLSAGSTYHVRAYATNSVGTAYGADLSFATLGKVPECITQAATNVTSSGATLNGTVNANYLSTTVTFEYGLTKTYGQTVTSAQSPVTGNSITNVSADLSGLNPGTTYHFRVVAVNSIGSTNGNDLSFMTGAVLPMLTTTLISNRTATTVTTGGNITSDGGASITARGVCWSMTSNPTILNSRTSDGTGTGTFTSNITGLTPGTLYYLRAYATNSAGTSYGDQISVTTDPAIVTDADGNDYNVIRIGTQLWMKENLRTTKYNDGNLIPNITENSQWINLSSPAYCWFNNDLDNYGITYGALYNWFAISTSFNGNKNVCPTGWHVPTETEWTTMESFLITNGYNYDGTTSGNKIAKSLASTTNWESSTNQGAVGNIDYPEKRNITGFSGLPAGDRQINGLFWGFGTNAVWWNSTGDIYFGECYEAITYESASLKKGTTYPRDHRYYGISVRCLKD
jgi:uncharacterized protein (TIGR02145 family)